MKDPQDYEELPMTMKDQEGPGRTRKDLKEYEGFSRTMKDHE
jgi:hypothetical protein